MFVKCSECELVGECFLTIVPGTEMDQDHIYTFRCSSCGHAEQKVRYAGSSIGSNAVTECPYCGCDSREHKLLEPETVQ